MLAVRQNVGEDYSIHPRSRAMIMFDFSYEKVGKNQDIVAVVLSGTIDENNCNYLLGCVENQILDRHTKLILDCGQVRHFKPGAGDARSGQLSDEKNWRRREACRDPGCCSPGDSCGRLESDLPDLSERRRRDRGARRLTAPDQPLHL